MRGLELVDGEGEGEREPLDRFVGVDDDEEPVVEKGRFEEDFGGEVGAGEEGERGGLAACCWRHVGSCGF